MPACNFVFPVKCVECKVFKTMVFESYCVPRSWNMALAHNDRLLVYIHCNSSDELLAGCPSSAVSCTFPASTCLSYASLAWRIFMAQHTQHTQDWEVPLIVTLHHILTHDGFLCALHYSPLTATSCMHDVSCSTSLKLGASLVGHHALPASILTCRLAVVHMAFVKLKHV